jgi:cation diffusion facilitator family transporter
VVIFASAAFAAYESYLKLISDRGTTNLYVGMAAAVIGMVGNLAVSRYKKHVARQIHSVTMEAEANHSWLDMISSLGALVGLVGVAFGYRWADPFAGFAVTLFIVHVGWEVTSEILHHLMDGVEPEHLEAATSETSMARAEEIGESVEAAVGNAVEEARHISWIPRGRRLGRESLRREL